MPEPNELYQFSVVSALMDGVAEQGLELGDLLKHGDLGLGTFRHMQGELIIVDGDVYQMKHDGSVRPADIKPGGDLTPFAQITQFKSTKQKRATIAGKEGIEPILDELCPGAHNAHVAFRIRGKFKNIQCRTAEGQCYPGEGLKGVASRQVTVTLGQDGPIKGVCVGFRSPAFLQGVSVAGVHMHFIDADRTTGGHVLALESEGEVEVETSEVWRSTMDLPRTEEFSKAKLKVDSDGIKNVEG